MVEYDIYQAQRLDEQFSEILDYQLDDFENNLAQLQKKKEILQGVTSKEGEREGTFKLEVISNLYSYLNGRTLICKF
jgi:hypothetical protein